MRMPCAIILLALLTSACTSTPTETVTTAMDINKKTDQSKVRFDGEVHFRHVQQLTFSGENAEAYFSGDNTELIFQSTRGPYKCDQMFRMDIDGKNVRRVSTGKGRTTCGFIFPNSPKIIYSSTHKTLKKCPEKPDYSKGYVWKLQPELDIYIAGPNGEKPTALAPSPGYDAEAVVSPQGDKILFTSTRDGDVDIYVMDADGTNVKRLTTEVGYDGGAFFSLDGKKIVYRAHHPKSPEGIKTFKSLLAENLVRPSIMELFVMDADGKNKRQITNNGAANFAPYFHPDGKRIVFSSNMDDPKGRNFDLYMINTDGTNLKRLTFNPSFDAFPMFSYDGQKLVFASNRNNDKPNETNLFIADWNDRPNTSVADQLKGQSEIDARTWQSRAARLSDPAFKGRGLHTPELEKAAKFIANQFAVAGLKPAYGNSYLQAFDVPLSKKVDAATISVDGQTIADTQARPSANSSSGEAVGQAIFVGYGIDSGEHKHNDFAKTAAALKDNVAIIFTHTPNANTFTRHADLSLKGILAKQYGAKAIVYVTPPSQATIKDELLPLTHDLGDIGIPTIHMTHAGAKVAFPKADWPALEKQAAKPIGKVQALAKRVKLNIKVSQQTGKAHNVVGRLPANKDGKPTPYALIIGAHYDHLGMGGHGSLRPNTKAIHPGADDNASGVASIVELAEALTAVKRKHDVYVVAFSAEESGLLGSTHFVNNAPIKTEKMVAMLNFDMVGRLDKALYLGGVGSAKQFRDMVRKAQHAVALNVQLNDSGYGPSDHLAFYLKRVPVLNFHTGLHGDYHTPNDTADKLNAKGAVSITKFAFELSWRLLNSPKLPQYVSPTKAMANHHGHHATRKKRGYGPYFGSIPSFAQAKVQGALIAGVTKNSPAEKAGLQKGDVIVQFGKYPVTSLREFAVAIRRHKPGQTIDVVVVRNGKKQTLKATLGKK